VVSKHLTFVGMGRGYKGPLPAGEVWNINVEPDRRVLKRLTRSFQIHPDDGRTKSEDAWLLKCPVTLYVCSRRDAVFNKHAVVYPWDRVPSTAPISSSFDCAMFLALAEGFTSIDFAGADLQAGTLRERLLERVSLAYWLGVAGGMGVMMTFDHDSRLLKHPYRYGRDYWRERRWAQQQCLSALANDELDDGGAKVNRRIKGVSFTGHRDKKMPIPMKKTGAK
jgi:hypothetical protein